MDEWLRGLGDERAAEKVVEGEGAGGDVDGEGSDFSDGSADFHYNQRT